MEQIKKLMHEFKTRRDWYSVEEVERAIDTIFELMQELIDENSAPENQYKMHSNKKT